MMAAVAVRTPWLLCHSPNPRRVTRTLACTVRPEARLLKPPICPELPSPASPLLRHWPPPTSPHKPLAAISAVHLALVEICSAVLRGLPSLCRSSATVHLALVKICSEVLHGLPWDRRLVLKFWTRRLVLCRLLPDFPKSNGFVHWECQVVAPSCQLACSTVEPLLSVKSRWNAVEPLLSVKSQWNELEPFLSMKSQWNAVMPLLPVKSQWSFCCW